MPDSVNHSPYQHQDPRQINLQQLIELAQQQDDQPLLTRLELQWVHRFGVASLPQGLLASEECSQSSMAQPLAEVAPIAAPESNASPAAKAEAASDVESELPSPGINRFSSLLKTCLDDVGRVVDPEISQNTPAPSLRPVPAAGPQRLRRWLTPVSQQDLPKAS
ncbi:hypothetical protein [Synechococcus sp. MIT S9504]|uniref:hypothetical protein n=1 Tax=Synechococcus sp. MIT S9504 TaxID=1801628 RepID=UPI00082FBD5C